MKNLFLFLKGILVGIGKIIPGVSGSLIATILGIYEDSIYAINHLKDNFKESVFYLAPIGCGVLLSTVLFSKVLIFFLGNYYVFTMFLFLGLILGTVPKFRKSFSFLKRMDYFIFLLSFFIPFLLSTFQCSQEFIPYFSFGSFFFIFFIGFLDAFSMVIPGISGTVLFLMLGSYSFVLQLFSNPFEMPFFTFLFGLGLIFGVFLTSRIIEYFLTTYRNQFFIVIYGLLWSSIVYLFLSIVLNVTGPIFFPVLFLLVLGFVLSFYLS